MSNKNSLISDFTQGSIPKQLLIFAAPMFLSNLMQILYNMVDMIIVGAEMGKVGQSAVSVGGDITHFLTFFAMGLSSAGQVIVSQYVGSGERQKLGKFIATMFTSILSCALLLSIFCFSLREEMLLLMNTPDLAYDWALDYSAVSVGGLFFIYGYNMVSAVLRGLGDSIHPFIFVSIAAVMNVALDLLFVFVLDMECMGAALATVISQGTSFLLCLGFLYRKRGELGLEFKPSFFFRLDMPMLSNLMKLGLPMAVKSASIQFSKLFVNSYINSFGVAVSAFAGIAAKIASVSNLISISFGNAGSSMVGQNIGAQKYERVPKIMFTVGKITFSVAAVMSALLLLFPEQIYGIFNKETDVMQIALEFLPVAVLLFFGGASRAPMNALLNGSGNHKVNFVTALLDGIILRIGLALLFGIVFNQGYMGFWLGDALAGFTPFFIGIVFYFSNRWKKRTIS